MTIVPSQNGPQNTASSESKFMVSAHLYNAMFIGGVASIYGAVTLISAVNPSELTSGFRPKELPYILFCSFLFTALGFGAILPHQTYRLDQWYKKGLQNHSFIPLTIQKWTSWLPKYEIDIRDYAFSNVRYN